jgi:histone acetyltransferase (RNA polymerase elongator complex component)
MMIGLPGDTLEKSLNTARAIIDLGADCTRIYPTLVIKGTELENLYHNNKYKPLTLTEAVTSSADILLLFEKAGINVIRIGIHPSEELLSGESLTAGPFHISFRELVITDIWKRIFENHIKEPAGSEIIIAVSPEEYNHAIGYNARNKKMLREKYKKVIFIKDDLIKGRNFHADYN